MDGIKLIETEMDDASITMFLGYLYNNSLHDALDSSVSAQTLLCAGIEFGVPSLREAVSRIVELRNNDWFTLSTACMFYGAAVLYQEKRGSDEIRTRVVKFLAFKSSELDSSSEFNSIFPSNDSKLFFKSILKEVRQ